MPRPHAVAVSAPPYAGTRLITPGRDEWPSGTAVLGVDAPSQLWVRGESLLAVEAPVLVTGCRASTTYGDHIASELAGQLTEAGCTVLTGCAPGIDAAATRGALTAGGQVVVALAGGVDVPYPRTQAPLFEEVTRRGSLLSAHPPGETPMRARFMKRNHLLAAIAAAVVVVEATGRSGVLAAAHIAHGWVKPVLAVPGPVLSLASSGPHRLIQQGTARLATSAADVLDALNIQGELS